MFISDYLYEHSKKYQESHVLVYRCGGWSTGYFKDSHLYKIPEKDRTKELCLKAYQWVDECRRTDTLKLMPSTYFEDKNFCIKLLGIDMKRTIDFIPSSYLTKDFLIKLVNESAYTIDYINCLKLADEELFELSFKNSNGETFKYYPKNKKTYEKCFEMASKYECAIKYIPEEIIDIKLINSWVKNLNDPYYLKFIPTDCLTDEIYSKITKKNSQYLSEVPEEYYDNIKTELNQ